MERRGLSQISQVQHRAGPLADPHGAVSQAMDATHGQAMVGGLFSEKPLEDACAYLVGDLEPAILILAKMRIAEGEDGGGQEGGLATRRKGYSRHSPNHST